MTPEGKLKKDCRTLCRKLDLIFWNIQGKGIGGIPDSMVGKYPKGSGVIIAEAKARGKKPFEQQQQRIDDLRAAGQDAGWYDSYERFCELIGYELDL